MGDEIVKIDERTMLYIPFGENEEVRLTIDMVRRYLCTPTKSGKWPTDDVITKFMMMCKHRQLNPWIGDAYLTGYDSQAGPQFSLITAAQAIFKRAENNPNFDGMESGVVVKSESGLEYREGDLILDGETLLGGWCKVYRKDRAKPFYDSLALKTFNTNQSRWAKDPAGMIVKCAEASALRKAFPSQTGGLYHAAEMESVAGGAINGPALPRTNGQSLTATPDVMPVPSFTEGTEATDNHAEHNDWDTATDSEPLATPEAEGFTSLANPAACGPNGEALFDMSPEYA